MTQSSTQLRFRDLLLQRLYGQGKSEEPLSQQACRLPGGINAAHGRLPGRLPQRGRVASPQHDPRPPPPRPAPPGRPRRGTPAHPRPGPPRTRRPWAPPQSALVRLSSRRRRPPARVAASCALGRARKDLESQGPHSGHRVEPRRRSRRPVRKSARRPTGLTNLKPSAGHPGGPAEPRRAGAAAPGAWTPRADPRDAAPEADGVAKRRRFQAAGSATLTHPEPPTR